MRVSPTVAAIVAMACATLAPRLNGQRMRHGDTTWVTSSEPGKFGPPATAREILRLGSGSDTLSFSYVIAMVALPNGGVAILDNQNPQGTIAPILYLISSDGKAKTLGRIGSGPGEFGPRNMPNCLSVDSRGTLTMYDHSNQRLNRWGPDGKFLGIVRLPFGPAPIGGQYYLPAPRGQWFLAQQLRRPNPRIFFDLSAYGWVRLDSTGRVLDTVPAPKSWLQKAPSNDYDPVTFWFPLPNGGRFVSSSDRLAFLTSSPEPSSRIAYAERSATRAAITAKERDELDQILNYGALPIAGIPRRTPGTLKSIFSSVRFEGSDGALWFQRNMPSEPVAAHRSRENDPKSPTTSFLEPVVFAGFQGDGTYLGEFRFPNDATLITIFRNNAWGFVTIAGEQVVVKWKLGK